MPGETRTSDLVGRRRERDQLRAALMRAADGRPGTVVLAGEAGIGKSTLLGAVLAETDATVLVGNSYPVAGEALPFAPLVQALRDLARTLSDDRRARLTDAWPVALVPLQPREGVAPPTDPHAPRSLADQGRLFEQMLSLLARLSAGRPLVLVVEDLHWADRSTLDLISFLAANLRAEPVLLVLTVRSDDLPRNHPLRPWLAELTRLPGTERVTMSRLARRDTARLLAQLLDGRPDEDLVGLVHDHAAGNPLFTEQVLPWVRDPTGPMPETLRDLVEARLGTLPDTTRRVLEVAAVLGREVKLATLAEVGERDEEDVEHALRVAVDRFLVEPRPGAAYGFRHPLFREVLEADLLPGVRRRLHHAAATALEKRVATDAGAAFTLTGQIARHWQCAEVADRAFRAAVRAGLAAEEVFAFAEADEVFTRALELADQLSDPLPDEALSGLSVDRAELLAHASQAAHLVGDEDRAVALAARAVDLGGEPVRSARLLERLGTYCFNAGRADEAETAYRAALDLLPTDPPSAARAQVLAGLAMLAMGWSRLDDARSWCRQAIDTARTAGARAEEGRALNALGVVTAYTGDIEAGLGYSKASLAIAREIDEPDELASAYVDLTHVLGLAGLHDEAVSVCRAGYEQMQRLGIARQDGTFLQANAAESLFRSGRWDEAEALIHTALEQRPRGMRAFPALAQSAFLAIGQGRLQVAAARVERVRVLGDQHGLPDAWRRELYEMDAELALWEHRPGDALTAAEAGLVLVAEGDEQTFAGQLVWLAARAGADLADLARVGRDTDLLAAARERVEVVVARARGFDPDPLEPGRHPLPVGRALAPMVSAELERLAQVCGEQLADAWATAAAPWHALGQPLPEAYARWREAEALVLAKHPGQRSVGAVRTAWTLARDLGAEALVGEVVRLAGWGRVDLPDTGPQGGRVEVVLPAQAPTPALGLTTRELEVLGALVGGSTNREIADALFISVKTASVHVSNILRKLDVSSREEAARVGHRLGLTPARA